MNSEKKEALFISGIYYVVIGCIFMLLSIFLKNDYIRTMIILNSIMATCSLLLGEVYKRKERVGWIVDIFSFIILCPILIILMVLDFIYNIFAFIYYLIKGGENDD